MARMTITDSTIEGNNTSTIGGAGVAVFGSGDDHTGQHDRGQLGHRHRNITRLSGGGIYNSGHADGHRVYDLGQLGP